jgi:K+-sensing histidine kinase KdpD
MAQRPDPTIVQILALVVPPVVAGLFAIDRDVLEVNTNVALVLVILIVGAAMFGGRLAGLFASASSALAYNFFHTEPYHSFTIDTRVDITTCILLFAVGAIVGEIVVQGTRLQERVEAREVDVRRLERVARAAALEAPEILVASLEAELVDALDLAACHYEVRPSRKDRPRLRGADLQIPAGAPPLTADPTTWAIELPVEIAGEEVGHFVLEPDHRTGGGDFTPEQRALAAAIADQFAAAIAVAAHPPSRRSS